jgi:CheY-like chemotaxis protein
MPIVDGLTSTKMIRSFEKTHPRNCLSKRAAMNGRIPIFAVSASLLESERQTYIDAGFDGWILKPVDFKRVSVLFKGIEDSDVRNDCLYQPGAWEKGGWFASRSPGIYAASTAPSVGDSRPAGSVTVGSVPDRGSDPFDDSISREQERLRGGTSSSASSSPQRKRR